MILLSVSPSKSLPLPEPAPLCDKGELPRISPLSSLIKLSRKLAGHDVQSLRRKWDKFYNSLHDKWAVLPIRHTRTLRGRRTLLPGAWRVLHWLIFLFPLQLNHIMALLNKWIYYWTHFKCKVQKNGDGEICATAEVSYNNQCRQLYEEDDQERRLEVDMFGVASFRCKRKFVEWEDGSCHLALSPADVCEPGHQIRWSVCVYSQLYDQSP